jgi:hypothetical protein
LPAFEPIEISQNFPLPPFHFHRNGVKRTGEQPPRNGRPLIGEEAYFRNRMKSSRVRQFTGSQVDEQVN